MDQRSCKITATEEINDSYKQDGEQHKEKECFKSVYLYNVRHLDTVLMTENVKRVYIDFDIFYRDEDEFSKALGKVAAASDIELYIGLPYILTQDNHELLCSLFDYVDTHFEGKVKGYLVRNLEEAGLLAKRKKTSLKNNRNCYDIIHFLRREMLDFTAFPVFFVSNLLLVQRKKYYFNRATVSRNCSIVL